MLEKISIIIPLAQGETAHYKLLNALPDTIEVIQSSQVGRAKSLNEGAHKASREFLWFLHADSELSDNAIQALVDAIGLLKSAEFEVSNPVNSPIYFFSLAFKNAPLYMKLNQWGVKIRANLCKIPFGDQGFCMHRTVFARLGGFDEITPYGEDHLLVRKAHRQKIPLVLLPATLYTSPRRYAEQGWIYTTLLYQYLWIKQALMPVSIKNVAIAVLVKTPDMSPVKTRLAVDITVKNAKLFYLLSVRCVSDMLKEQPHATYFAVAEEEAITHKMWKQCNVMHSGVGAFAERLDHVYSTLISSYDAVILIGADTPQMTVRHIEQAIIALNDAPYVMGPATDGGFYLFAGKKPIAKAIWTQVEYSVSSTREALITALDAPVALLPLLSDVDTKVDFYDVIKQMPVHCSKAQQALMGWVEALLKK